MLLINLKIKLTNHEYGNQIIIIAKKVGIISRITIGMVKKTWPAAKKLGIKSRITIGMAIKIWKAAKQLWIKIKQLWIII